MKTQRIAKKIQKIKSTFPLSILNRNPDISDKLNSLDWITDPVEKEKVLQEILQILKNPWKLKSITDELGWATTNNSKYLEFKSSLLGLDSSFESYFNDLENINLNTDDLIEEIETESWWTIDIDLKANPPISKMSLDGSLYSFDKEIDKKALFELMTDSQDKLDEVKNAFTVLKDFWISFDSLLVAIKENWGKEDFTEKLKESVTSFSNEIFSNLDDVYEDMGIKSDEQIKESDIANFSDINSPSDLKLMIENIKTKFLNIKSTIWEKQIWVLKTYKTEVRELVQRKSETKEKQLEVLKFMKSSGFDLIPKEISSRIIRELKSNMLIIPWLPLSVKNINLKNGNFGESSVFVDKEAWLNIESKRNLVKFLNKMITWNISEPVPVEGVVNWFSTVDPVSLKNEFIKSDIANGLGWQYNRIIDNLKKDNQL